MTILDTIGGTRLVRLRHLVPEGSAGVLLKDEYENPTGRRDRMALAMVEIRTVSSEKAMAAARRLAREEGIFAGSSTEANGAVALRVAERLGPTETVVTVAVDSGMKYLSTALYSRT